MLLATSPHKKNLLAITKHNSIIVVAAKEVVYKESAGKNNYANFDKLVTFTLLEFFYFLSKNMPLLFEQLHSYI